MSSDLNAAQRQSLYEREQSHIGKSSGLLSVSCKFAWAGSLAIFFSSYISADDVAFSRLKDVFSTLRMSAVFGAICFVAEIFQYYFAYLFACRYTKWLEDADSVTREGIKKYRSTSLLIRSNALLFHAKILCAILSAILLVVATWTVSLQRLK